MFLIVVSLASFKSRLILPLWYWLTQVVLEKRPLNGSVVVQFLVIFLFSRRLAPYARSSLRSVSFEHM